ncbi:MAG: TIGR03668 family PPOX class F420-dependent oxidoreductase [Candidatus Limnocylindrales bacterium]
MAEVVLTAQQRAFLDAARRATLATTAPDGRPRLVPICFVLAEDVPAVYSPLDEKPKRSADPRELARVRDLLVLPEATILVDRWEEDWRRLAWLRAYGTGELLEPEDRALPEHSTAVEQLRAKYPQYRDQALERRPVIRITLTRVVTWGPLA